MTLPIHVSVFSAWVQRLVGTHMKPGTVGARDEAKLAGTARFAPNVRWCVHTFSMTSQNPASSSSEDPQAGGSPPVGPSAAGWLPVQSPSHPAESSPPPPSWAPPSGDPPGWSGQAPADPEQDSPEPGTSGQRTNEVKDTATAVFGEMKAAVSGASKREPYPFLVIGAAAAVILWLVWPENDKIGAQNLKLWTVFVLGCVGLLFVPMVRKVFRLDPQRAWQFCAGGAAGLAFSWVAFLLPSISTNQSFFGTIGAGAAGLAAWTAPGKPE